MSDTALLVDMLNSYQHEDAEALADSVAEIVAPLAGLVDRVRDRDDIDVGAAASDVVDAVDDHQASVQEAASARTEADRMRQRADSLTNQSDLP
jgi:hypothetical protein